MDEMESFSRRLSEHGEAFLSLFDDVDERRSALEKGQRVKTEPAPAEGLKTEEPKPEDPLEKPSTPKPRARQLMTRKRPGPFERRDRQCYQREKAAFLSPKAVEIHKIREKLGLPYEVDMAEEKEQMKEFHEFQRDVEKLGVKGFDRSASAAYLDDKWIELGGKKPPGKAIPKNIGTEIWKQKQKEQPSPKRTQKRKKSSKSKTPQRRSRLQ